MSFLSRNSVLKIVEKAINNREILEVTYKHKDDGEVVIHQIAPFDVGSTNTNPKIRDRNKNNLYAYSFTHLDDKTNRSDPKVCAFNVEQFILLKPTDQVFNENELAQKNLQAHKFDYRGYTFALLPNRDWFGRKLQK